MSLFLLFFIVHEKPAIRAAPLFAAKLHVGAARRAFDGVFDFRQFLVLVEFQFGAVENISREISFVHQFVYLLNGVFDVYVPIF